MQLQNYCCRVDIYYTVESLTTSLAKELWVSSSNGLIKDGMLLDKAFTGLHLKVIT